MDSNDDGNECELCGRTTTNDRDGDGDFVCDVCKNEPNMVAQAEAGRGGWFYGQWLTKEEIEAAEKRWVKAAYQDRSSDEYQCGGCRFFAAFGADYGVCCNPDSCKDGRVMFEHGGCNVHSVRILHKQQEAEAVS